MLRESDGVQAVRMARSSIEAALSPGAPRDPAFRWKGETLPTLFDEPRGVFVTLKAGDTGSLRGCIGFPLPVYPLRVAVPRVAVAAALEDPRFPPVASAELPTLAVEVSILTVPERLPSEDPARRVDDVVVGRDGLIVDADGASGLLLPQVATEEGWDARTLLDQTCRKAGLPASAWRRSSTTVRRFAAEVFQETSPGGPVRRSPRSTPG
ncbi:MAG: TIGR00296 family protein [Thermoplasmata archaeon]|nr:TIGR00296 family protein [Thermoplasmata archaeon]